MVPVKAPLTADVEADGTGMVVTLSQHSLTSIDVLTYPDSLYAGTSWCFTQTYTIITSIQRGKESDRTGKALDFFHVSGYHQALTCNWHCFLVVNW